jgi:hypothetical protein
MLSSLIVQTRNVAVHGVFCGTLRNGADVRIRFADFFKLSADGLFVRRDTFFFQAAV